MSYPQARGVTLSKLGSVIGRDTSFESVTLHDTFKNKVSSSKTLLSQRNLAPYDTMTLFSNKVFQK